MRIAALIVGAGEGRRFLSSFPKQYHRINGKSIFQLSIESFCRSSCVDVVVPVINKKFIKIHKKEVSYPHAKLLEPVSGGSMRQKSVLNGLRALQSKNCDIVLVHDACRPFVTENLIKEGIEILKQTACAVPIIPLNDSLFYENEDYIAHSSKGIYKIQTPQFFLFKKLLAAHESTKGEFADDASMMKNEDIQTFIGDPANVKITYQQDLVHSKVTHMSRTKVGTGVDFHQFQEDIPLMICGVQIPYTKGLAGHSDGDVGLHAIVDAALGAASLGDIGSYFPKEEKWKGANSRRFLEHVVKIIKSNGNSISNIDVTIICQEPAISPYKEKMRNVVSEIACLNKNSVNIKATTTDHMGFLGRKEGICAMSVVTVFND